MRASLTHVQSRLFAAGLRHPEPLTLLSDGLGQNSAALLYLLYYDPELMERYAPGRFIVMASDTGTEHDETRDQHVPYIKSFCRQAGIQFEHVTPDLGHHGDEWQSLESYYEKGRIGSKSYPKSCSDRLKIQPWYYRLEEILAEDYGVAHGRKRGLYEYVELTGQRIRVLIGFTVDEFDRRVDEKDPNVPVYMKQCIERVFPLAELGMTRSDCQEYIAHKGHPVPYPSLCEFCPFKDEKDLLYMWRFKRDRYLRWVELEQNKFDTWRGHIPPEKNHGVWPGKSLPEVLEKAKIKYGHLSDEELEHHRMTHGHCVKSKF